MAVKWEIYKAEYGLDYAPLEVPEGFVPFAFVAADQQPAVQGSDTIIGVVVFARKVED